MTDTPIAAPLDDDEVFWMTRPSDGVRVLILKVNAGEFVESDEHAVGIIEMTTELATKLLARIDRVKEWKALDSMLCCAQFWNYEVEYHGWNFETEHPTWLADAGRTEMDLVDVSDDSLEWRCYIKHTDDQLTTTTISEKDLRAFVAGNDPWPWFGICPDCGGEPIDDPRGILGTTTCGRCTGTGRVRTEAAQ